MCKIHVLNSPHHFCRASSGEAVNLNILLIELDRIVSSCVWELRVKAEVETVKQLEKAHCFCMFWLTKVDKFKSDKT